MIDKLKNAVHPVFSRLSPVLNKFWDMNGEQLAAAFAYYAFFSLFPLVLLLVTLASLLVEREKAASLILDHIRQYVPLTPENQDAVIETIDGVIEGRGRVGVMAFLFLLYGGMRFFHVLVRGVNRAWGTTEYSWWRLPLRNLLMLAVLVTALILGVVVPTILRLVQGWIPLRTTAVTWVFDLAVLLVPVLVLFYGFSMLYKLAPRRPRRFSEIWRGALFTTVLLWLLEHGILIFFTTAGHFNALYGALGSVMALLLWIYISGIVILFGACIDSKAEK